jgi:hypothetical protein
VKNTVHLRVKMTDPQSERLQQRLASLPFKVDYQEEQRGAVLIVVIDCTPSQEKLVRDLLHELGVLVEQHAVDDEE